MSKTKEIEIFKDIPEYKGLYQISNWGRVKSLPRNGTKGGILTPRKNRFGYLCVVLCKNNIHKTFFTHRLVALTFLKNDNNYPCVNHKDENKQNNCVENLEWVSYQYNTNYGTRNIRAGKKISEIKKEYLKDKENNPFYGKHHSEESKQKIREKLKGKHHSEESKQKISKAIKKPIIQFTKDMVFVREFDSAKSAKEILNINNITACCKGRQKTCGGYIWRYKE